MARANTAYKPVTKDDENDVKSAVDKLNRSTTLLFRILSFLSDQWHPDAKMPELTSGDLDKSIQDADAAIQSLIDANHRAKDIAGTKKGVVDRLGNGAKTVCVHIKPFVQTFLGIAVHGSAVLLCERSYMLISRFQSSILLGYSRVVSPFLLK